MYSYEEILSVANRKSSVKVLVKVGGLNIFANKISPQRKIIIKNQSEYDKKINKSNKADANIIKNKSNLYSAIRSYIDGKHEFYTKLKELSNVNIDPSTISDRLLSSIDISNSSSVLARSNNSVTSFIILSDSFFIL